MIKTSKVLSNQLLCSERIWDQVWGHFTYMSALRGFEIKFEAILHMCRHFYNNMIYFKTHSKPAWTTSFSVLSFLRRQQKLKPKLSLKSFKLNSMSATFRSGMLNLKFSDSLSPPDLVAWFSLSKVFCGVLSPGADISQYSVIGTDIVLVSLKENINNRFHSVCTLRSEKIIIKALKFTYKLN